MDVRSTPAPSRMSSNLTAVHSPRNSIGDASETCGSAPDTGKKRRSRSDSGYGDGDDDDSISLVNDEDKHHTDEPLPTSALSRRPLCTTFSTAPVVSNRENPLADAWAKAWPACQPRRSSTSCTRASKSLSHCNSMNQRSSTLSQSSHLRMPSGRSSSTRTPQGSLYSSHRLQSSLQSTSAVYNSSHDRNPYLVHQRSLQLFGPPGNVMARPSIERFSSLPNTSYASITEVEDDVSSDAYTEKSSAATYHLPSTIIDWTSPSTRRREYEEIDKSSRGVRRLWRRLTPRWCRSNSRLKFYNGGEEDDAGSVRRYRLDLPKLDEKKNSSTSGDKGRPATLQRSATSWSCFNSHRYGEKLE